MVEFSAYELWLNKKIMKNIILITIRQCEYYTLLKKGRYIYNSLGPQIVASGEKLEQNNIVLTNKLIWQKLLTQNS